MKESVRAALLVAVLVAAPACSDSNPTEPDTFVDPPAGVVISDVAADVAFLSAIPGSLPGVISISVTNKTTPGATRNASVVDGGFDPIAVSAQAGDDLSLAVSLAAGGTTMMAVEVPARRPPTVVRTSPSKGLTGVEADARVVVVFSEPIEILTVTPSSLTLTNAGTPVKGRISVSPDRLTAEFIPDNALSPQATYALAVDGGIRDLDGDALRETAVVTFTTFGPAPPGAIEITVLTSGPDQDADGYTLSVQATISHHFGRPAANDTVTLTGIEPGGARVVLYQLAPNCSLAGNNPLTVGVQSGVTTRVTFTVNCVASGSLRVTTVTTGADPDESGYYMFDQDRGAIRSDISHSFTSGLDLGLSTNGTVVASALAPGTYLVAVSNVEPNCTPGVAALQTITIVAGVESSLTFEVRCVAPLQIAFVRGLGRDDSNIADTDIYLANSNGTGTVRLTSQPGADIDPAWSPDGSRIAFASDRAGNREIYAMNADGSDPVRLTNHPAADYQPAYSPDGKRIAFVSRRDGNAELYVMNADGTGAVRLTSNLLEDAEPAWSPDGTRIAFSRAGNIYVMSSAGSGETWLTFSAENRQPAWSPDGNTIAMLSTGRDIFPAVYLMNADGSQVRRILGVGYFPSSPDWSPDGKTIAFDDWDCWDNGPCPRGIVIGTAADGLYSGEIREASQPAWRPRPLN